MDKNLSYIKERVLEVAKIKGVSYEKFCESIGMTYGSFKGSQKKTALNSDALDKLLSIYNDVNPGWLLTGKGSPLIEVTNGSVNVYKLRTDRNHGYQDIPLYDLEATAGLVSLFKHQGDTQPIDFISIPNLPKCDGAVGVTGDSMYPLLKSGDIVMYKELELDINNIFFGEMYLISIDLSGEEYVSVKWIQRSNKGDDYIKLVSENQHHQPKDIPLKKVRALALVKASIRINAMR
ncbi:MAG TPA: S24 family peptidase [Flavobacteriaceae bacterium]|nr:S24 family peptidase [Flavobacteriaceae bacterium]